MRVTRFPGGKLLLWVIALALPGGQASAQGAATDAELAFARSWIAGISATSPDEAILVAAMFAYQHQPASVPALLEMELVAPAHDKLRLSIAWYYCRNSPEAELCARHAFADELTARDPANLEPYLYAVLTLLDAGRNEAALAALTLGNGATQANTYYLDKLHLVRSNLMRAGYPAERINSATETLPAPVDTYLVYARLLAECAARSAGSAQWKAQCLALGSKLETLGNTVVQNVHGMAIQRDALGADADAEARQAIVDRLAAYNHIRDRAGAALDWIHDESRKPELVYQEAREFGEIQSIERALQRLDD